MSKNGQPKLVLPGDEKLAERRELQSEAREAERMNALLEANQYNILSTRVGVIEKRLHDIEIAQDEHGKKLDAILEALKPKKPKKERKKK